jgi:ABC-type phosphate transport system substrate-binding protein
MISHNAKWLFALVAGVGCSSVCPYRPASAQASDDLVMVVNRNNIGAAGMNLEEARKLVLGETGSWRNGTKVVVLLGPAGNSDRAAVLKKVCGMSEAAYTRFEMQASFTGQTAATVEVVASDAAVKSSINANSGALGFIHKSQVDATVRAALELP